MSLPMRTPGSPPRGRACCGRRATTTWSGTGENIDVPTIDVISAEINIIGDLVGSYNDLCGLMVLAARGAVTLHTERYTLDDFQSAVGALDAGRVRGRAVLTP